MTFNSVLEQIKQTTVPAKISGSNKTDKNKKIIFHDTGGAGQDQVDFEACVDVLSGKKKVGIKKNKADKVH